MARHRTGRRHGRHDTCRAYTRRPARGGIRRRHQRLETRPRRGGRAGRAADTCDQRFLRPGDRRGGPGRSGGGGVRRIRRVECGLAEQQCSRRSGRHQLAHRELSRLPRRPVGRRSGAEGRYPSQALRHRNNRPPSGRKLRPPGTLQTGDARGRQRNQQSRPDSRDRRRLPQTRHPGNRPLWGCRRVLRLLSLGGDGLPGRGGLRRRSRQLGRTGSDVPGRLRIQGDRAGSG